MQILLKSVQITAPSSPYHGQQQDILIENAVLQSRKGLVCIEAERIQLKNVALITPAKTVITNE